VIFYHLQGYKITIFIMRPQHPDAARARRGRAQGYQGSASAFVLFCRALRAPGHRAPLRAARPHRMIGHPPRASTAARRGGPRF
jgi:hypothetical protein